MSIIKIVPYYFPPSSGTPSSFIHFVISISLHYFHPLRCIIIPTFVHSSGEPRIPAS